MNFLANSEKIKKFAQPVTFDDKWKICLRSSIKSCSISMEAQIFAKKITIYREILPFQTFLYIYISRIQIVFFLKNSSYERIFRVLSPCYPKGLYTMIKWKFPNKMIHGGRRFKNGGQIKWISPYLSGIRTRTCATGNIVHRFDSCYLWYLRCTPAMRLSWLLWATMEIWLMCSWNVNAKSRLRFVAIPLTILLSLSLSQKKRKNCISIRCSTNCSNQWALETTWKLTMKLFNEKTYIFFKLYNP